MSAVTTSEQDAVAQAFADVFFACLMNGATTRQAAQCAVAAFMRNGKFIDSIEPARGRLPSREWSVIRFRILERDEYTCSYCGDEADHVDHVHPISRGGSNHEENLVASCARCNKSKGNRLLSEWRRPQ